ncbi:MAG TPA: hypothetical protein VF407_18955, partial [Polyangiaceae bacterium]
RLDAIGELGATYYHGAGQDLFDDNPGRNGFTPTVRAKAGISYAFAPRAPSHFVLGLWGTGEDDLTRDTKAVTFQQHDLFGGGSEQTTERDTIGTARVGAVVSLGAAF